MSHILALLRCSQYRLLSMAGSLPIVITNRKRQDLRLKWLQLALWTLLLVFWFIEKHWLWVGISTAFLALALRPNKAASLQRITEVSLDEESLTIARADGSSFGIPVFTISHADATPFRINVAYRQNEELLTQVFRSSEFDPSAWGELQVLSARFPGG